MPVLRTITFILLIAVFYGCDKEVTTRTADCNEFTSALILQDKPQVKQFIDQYIIQSSALTHTENNLQKLVTYISSKCRVQASIQCYACIKTLPEMSEIVLRWQDGNNEVTRRIDLSGGFNDDKMQFRSVHD